MINKIKFVTGAVVVLVIAVGSAHAGFKITTGVSVDTTTRQARGTARYARLAPDTTSAIGCTVLGSVGSAPLALCVATDRLENSAYCFSVDPGIVAAAASGGTSSFYTFDWNQDAECTFLQVDNVSYSGPMEP